MALTHECEIKTTAMLELPTKMKNNYAKMK